MRDAGDIFPFLSLCDPVRWRFNARAKFVRDICHTFQGEYATIVGKVRDPQAFHAMLGRYSIRRKWNEIPSLASLQRRDIKLPVQLDQRTLNRHRAIKKDWRDPETGDPILSSGAMVHELRRLSVPAKVATASELVQDSTGRWLLVAWYRDTARQVAEMIGKFRPVAYVDGGTSIADRERAYAIYKRDPNACLVGTIGSLKEGLNLQAGSQIAFVEEHYLPSDNGQVIGRQLRTGQTQPVLVYWIYAERTFDVKIRRVSRNRKANIDKALEEFIANEEWTQ